MKRILSYFILFLVFASWPLKAQENTFKVIPLGVKGGLDESNLSAYLLAPTASKNYICLDAGTVYAGIAKAISNGVFSKSPEYILKNNIKAYLISHAHLDHVSGLIINAPADSPKDIYSSQYVINVFKNNYFTWQSWANFANEGEKPQLNTYHYKVLETQKEVALKNTELYIRPFTLSHSNPYKSLAFLIRFRNSYILYLGDTGSDKIEKSDKLDRLWKAVSPLIKTKQLKAIFIEVSFPNSQSNTKLFGHLKPSLFYDEINALAKYTGIQALNNFPIIITHRKPHKNNEAIIKEELLENNKLKLNLIFPKQGELLKF
ncbi:MAG: 3',5'-cyclic-nucleotide phosphodiesterase [Flavobacteriaceae bacterium]|nr:3',5'-cyclic-nucleotide phosphodiesterase [Flavobacteriaceae bacterium]